MTPVAPPAMSARITIGFMSAYGKYTSWMPPKNWMTAAPGAEARAAPMPKNVNASSSPTPGPGLASRRKRIEDPVLGGLLDAERRQHAVVDGVVEEQHLRRLDDDARQRQEVHRHEPVTALLRICMSPLTRKAIG